MIEGAGWSSPAGELHAIAALLGKSGRAIESTIQGTSMEPTIPDGARIKVCPSPTGRYEIGDVAACVHRGALVAHRIVSFGAGRARGYVITQGDGRLICDRPLRREEILGAVTEFSVAGAWHAPAREASRGPLQRVLARAHLRLIELCLAISYGLACHVARATLLLSFGLKSVLGRLRAR